MNSVLSSTGLKGRAVAPNSETRKTILVADDEEIIRILVSGFLTHNGYKVMVAENGDDALVQSRAYEDKIHLLLSDFKMPGLTGVDLSTKIALERPGIRVVLMSGFAPDMLVLNQKWH